MEKEREDIDKIIGVKEEGERTGSNFFFTKKKKKSTCGGIINTRIMYSPGSKFLYFRIAEGQNVF